MPPQAPLTAKYHSVILNGTETVEAAEELPEVPVTRLSTLRDGYYYWVGLRRDESELADGPTVGHMLNGEVDGGTWWLVLGKSQASRSGGLRTHSL